jgi:trigger factor
MQVTVEKPKSGLEHKMNVVVPVGDLDSKVEKRLNEIRRTIKMDGFRPGKVPLNVVKKRHGAEVRQEFSGEIIQTAFYDAVAKEALNVAGYPMFESFNETDGNIEFVAKFEVFPSVDLPEFSKLKIEKIKAEVTDKDVKNMITKLREQKSAWKPCSAAKKAKKGEQVIISFVGKKDGEEFEGGKADDLPLELGSGRMIPGFEDGIEGMKKGEEKTIDVTFPENYQSEELAGQAVTFDITVHSVQKKVLPELDEAFVKGLGIEDGKEESLVDEIKTNMEKELTRAVDNKNRTQILDSLSAKVDVELPKSVIQSEASTLMQRQIEQFQQQGVKAEDVGLTIDVFLPEAEKRVKLGLILGDIIKANKLTASDEARKAFIEDQASSYEEPSEVIKWYAQNPDAQREIDSIIVEKQVSELIAAGAKVKEVKKSFDQVVNQAA